MNTMVLPSTQPTAVSSTMDVDSLPPNSSLRPNEERSIPINQVEMLDENEINMGNDLPVDNNIMVSIPDDHGITYDYMNDIRPTVTPVSSLMDAPNAKAICFKHQNCTTWEYPIYEKKTAKIRLALQEGQLFFDLDDILENVCGIDATPAKLTSLTKTLTLV